MNPQLWILLRQPEIRSPYRLRTHSASHPLILSLLIADPTIRNRVYDVDALSREFADQGLCQLPD
jgi:hypothetical protein